jgi:hypothetical protein
MPKIKKDFSKTIMYKLRHITDINDIEVYVGHTTNFSKRKTQHKTDCYCITGDKYNEKKYQAIRLKGGWEEWEMLPIELYPCSNKIEACIREEYWRSHFNAQLNALKAHTTEQERKEASKRYMKEYNPIYQELNKESIKEQRKRYYEENKEHINTQNNINYHNNKEEYLAKQKERYEANKEQILAKQKEKITCECGCILAKNNMRDHRKSKKHIDLMENINKN